MTRNQLIKELCSRESKKSEGSIGNKREDIKHLIQMEAEALFWNVEPTPLNVLQAEAVKLVDKMVERNQKLAQKALDRSAKAKKAKP